MRKSGKRVFLALVFAFLVVAVLAACPRRLTPASSGSRVVGGFTPPHNCLTHIGQPAANFVALRCNDFSGFACTVFRRQHLDGGEDSFPFTIPSSMVFVITDVSWSASAPTGSAVRFFIQSRAPSNLYARSTVADSTGFVAVADHFTTGFAFSTMPGFVIIGFDPNRAKDIGVQGYLVSQCASLGAIFEATSHGSSIPNAERSSPRPTDR